MDEGDEPGRAAAEAAGNDIIVLDEAETAPWREAAEAVVDDWIAEMDQAGNDGAALVEKARELVEAHAGG